MAVQVEWAPAGGVRSHGCLGGERGEEPAPCWRWPRAGASRRELWDLRGPRQHPHAVAMVLAVLAPREMVEYGSDPRRPLVADTACARIFPARGMAHIPAQSSHLRLGGEWPCLKLPPGVACAGRLAAGCGGLGCGGTETNAMRLKETDTKRLQR